MTNHEQRAYDALAMKLAEAGYAYENTSWGNDATSSITVTCMRVVKSEGEEDAIHKYQFHIFVPNCDYWDPENEFYDTYTIADEGLGRIDHFYSPDGVVEHIQDCTGDVHLTN